jgi:hypothetical protein
MTGDESGFEARAREALNARVESVDGRTRSRLNRARQAALAQHATGAGERTFRVPGLWLPGGVLASAAVLALAVWVARPVAGPTAPVAEASPLEDAEILSSSEGPDLVADDADFYAWADTDGDGAGGTG